MIPRAWIDTLTFNDGTTINLNADDTVIIVGPNNAGKSATLNTIWLKLQRYINNGPVVSKLSITKEGTIDDVMTLVESIGIKHDNSIDPQYEFFGFSTTKSNFSHIWGQHETHDLTSLFCKLLSTEQRLQSSKPAQNYDFVNGPPREPVHFIFRDDRIEQKISDQFNKAFGLDFIVHRCAGGSIPMYVGKRPVPAAGQDRLSLDYVKEVEKQYRLEKQGDGMRSFAGILIDTFTGHESILLIDEPEAFLHPPQARLIGKLLVTEKPTSRQIFIASHSGDVLRGMLDPNSPNVRVIRIRRQGDMNIVKELDNSQVAQLWNDPLLRYSNILDGVFHEAVVIGESDSDCRFYAAIMDTIWETKSTESKRPDVMFTHCGGKARLPLVIKSLRNLDVPIVAITDFDILNDEHPLREIFEATGGLWTDIESDWRLVKTSIEARKPELSSDEVRNDIEGILGTVNTSMFPAKAKREIQDVLRRSSPWSTAKTQGKSYIPSGDPTQAYGRLTQSLNQQGVYIVPVGELEGFVRSVGGHGPKWVNEVLQKDLRNDSELKEARDFVGSLPLISD